MSLVPVSTNLPQLADPVAAALEDVSFDLYRDVHKGLRAELLGLPVLIGQADPHDQATVDVVAGRLHAFLDLLDDHAEHEEQHLGQLIARLDPTLSSRVEDEHRTVERTMDALRALADRATSSATATRRMALHRLYLTSASFASEYLAHLSTEEVEIMPLLGATVPVDELLAVNDAIVQSVAPGQMDHYLELMVPAQNPLDRTEMYIGIREGAPAEVFDHLFEVARGVLDVEASTRLHRELGGT